MINRRDFHGLALALLATGVAGPLHAKTLQSQEDLVLNRLTFGASAASREALRSSGIERWLDEQLAAPPESDALMQRLGQARLLIEYGAGKADNNKTWQARKELMPYQYLDAPGEAVLKFTDYGTEAMDYEERIRPAREVQAAAMIRAVHGEAQLREVMTQFWHDHFSVNAMRDQNTAAFFAIYDKMLRANAFGNFRTLLGEMTKSGSMLFYLNNDASRASPANENFARELFELHTLGAENYLNDTITAWRDVPGAADGLAQGYIDQDVYEAARALTGWSFGDGRWIAEGETAPKSGAFHYVDRWHDPYQKRILGIEFEANAAPMADGERLLDTLASHPATARFVCRKMVRRLLSDDPPEPVVDAAVAAWTANQDKPDQMAHVIRAIVLSPEFSATPPSKLKRPFEFLTSYYRAIGAEVKSPSLSFLWMLSRAGWMQHEFRPPTGHPDRSENWANTSTLSTYVDVALNGLEDWTELGRVDFNSLVPESNRIADAHRNITGRMHGVAASKDAAAQMAKAITDDENATLPETKNERDWVLKSMIAFSALTPQFLYR